MRVCKLIYHNIAYISYQSHMDKTHQFLSFLLFLLFLSNFIFRWQIVDTVNIIIYYITYTISLVFYQMYNYKNYTLFYI